jgi:cation transport ATPase
MTKWARLRKRKEKRRAEEAARSSHSEGKEVKLTQPEQITNNTQHSQEIEKLDDTKTSKPSIIISQIARYVYLLAIFSLLASVFFPLITQGTSFNPVIAGTATLFLGLVGGILLFKGITSDKRRRIFIIGGFVAIAISLLLIYRIQEIGLEGFYI